MTRRFDLPKPGDPLIRPERNESPGEIGHEPARERDGRPVIGVLAIQGDVSEHARALERAGAAAIWIKRPDDLDRVSGLVLPGGESTTQRRLLDHEGLLARIRERYAGGMPVLGTCAGAILLATEVEGAPAPHLGLVDMTVRRNAFGRQRESFVTSLQIERLGGGPLEAVFIRAPTIDRVGRDVDVLATLEGEVVLAETDQALVASFHPELSNDLRLHRRFLDKVTSAARAGVNRTQSVRCSSSPRETSTGRTARS